MNNVWKDWSLVVCWTINTIYQFSSLDTEDHASYCNYFACVVGNITFPIGLFENNITGMFIEWATMKHLFSSHRKSTYRPFTVQSCPGHEYL